MCKYKRIKKERKKRRRKNIKQVSFNSVHIQAELVRKPLDSNLQINVNCLLVYQILSNKVEANAKAKLCTIAYGGAFLLIILLSVLARN